MKAPKPKAPRQQRDERYRERCFPGAEQEVFDTSKGGFVPLPIITRKLSRYLSDAELRVWLYLQTRASRWFVCYPTYEEIMRETGIRSRGTISKAIRSLEKNGFIKSHNDDGVRRYLVRDPRLAAKQLAELGEITPEKLEDINDLLEQLKQPLVEQSRRQPVVVPLAPKVSRAS